MSCRTELLVTCYTVTFSIWYRISISSSVNIEIQSTTTSLESVWKKLRFPHAVLLIYFQQEWNRKCSHTNFIKLIHYDFPAVIEFELWLILLKNSFFVSRGKVYRGSKGNAASVFDTSAPRRAARGRFAWPIV